MVPGTRVKVIKNDEFEGDCSQEERINQVGILLEEYTETENYPRKDTIRVNFNLIDTPNEHWHLDYCNIRELELVHEFDLEKSLDNLDKLIERLDEI